jgi:hypothetical protein
MGSKMVSGRIADAGMKKSFGGCYNVVYLKNIGNGSGFGGGGVPRGFL